MNRPSSKPTLSRGRRPFSDAGIGDAGIGDVVAMCDRHREIALNQLTFDIVARMVCDLEHPLVPWHGQELVVCEHGLQQVRDIKRLSARNHENADFVALRVYDLVAPRSGVSRVLLPSGVRGLHSGCRARSVTVP